MRCSITATELLPVQKHPVFLVGFRPFFICAFISGVLFPLIWAAIFSGSFVIPSSILTPLQWHVHEMFFGFAWAVLAGFLLTASKNWVKIRGMHGTALAIAVVLWIIERGIIFVPAPSWMIQTVLHSSVAYVVGYVVYSLVRYRKQDTFADNWLFIISLPLLLVSKNLILSSDSFTHGWIMAIGLFRLAFLIMLERTTTQFMKNSMNVTLLRSAPLDFTIKILGFALVFESFLPNALSVPLLGLLALALTLRFVLWKPLLAVKNFGIALMYVGYFGIVIHLLFEISRITGSPAVVGNIAAHSFAFLTMGTIIPAMLIRISQGHTGRKLVFAPSDKIAFSILWLGAFLRLIAPQIWPGFYLTWISLSAAAWSLCFAIIGWRLIPFLLLPRIDGKEH